jgi:hypothetical protein
LDCIAFAELASVYSIWLFCTCVRLPLLLAVFLIFLYSVSSFFFRSSYYASLAWTAFGAFVRMLRPFDATIGRLAPLCSFCWRVSYPGGGPCICAMPWLA